MSSVSASSSDSNLWIAGVVITVGATVASNGGINLQKLSIMRELVKPKNKQRPYVLQPLWLVGFVGVILGAVGDFGALAFAAQSLLIPLGGFTLIANIYFARVCLGERMSRRDFIATIIILIGIVMIAVTGSKEERTYTLAELIHLYSQPAFIGYLIVVVAAIIMLYLFQRYSHNLKLKFGPWSKEYLRVQRSYMFCLPMLAGVFGAQTIWTAKSVAEMVKTTVRGDNQFKYFGVYALTIVLVATVISQLHFLSMSLRVAPALLVIPVFQSVFITLSIIGGGVYFQELASLSGVQVGIFMVGLLILLFGMILLSRRKVEAPPPPTKFFLAATIVRFIIRTRLQLRQEQHERWPNRLHLYSCDCSCHEAVLTGEQPITLVNGRVLSTIEDVDEQDAGSGGDADEDDEDDSKDYALAKAAAAAAAAAAQQRHSPSDSALTKGQARNGSCVSEEEVSINVLGSSDRSLGPGLTPQITSPAGSTHFVPPACPKCLCRVTPTCILLGVRQKVKGRRAAEALMRALEQASVPSIDGGLLVEPSPLGGVGISSRAALVGLASPDASSRTLLPHRGGRSASIEAQSEWDAALAELSAQEATHSTRAPTSTKTVGTLPTLAALAGSAGGAAALPSSAESNGAPSVSSAPTPSSLYRRASPGAAASGGGGQHVTISVAGTPASVEAPLSSVSASGSAAAGAPSASAARRGSRMVTKDEVASVMKGPRTVFYNANNPAVPSYLTTQPATRLRSGSRYTSDEAGDEDEDDMVVAAINHLGEGIARLGARTHEGLRSGITAVTSRLKLAPSGGASAAPGATAAEGAAEDAMSVGGGMEGDALADPFAASGHAAGADAGLLRLASRPQDEVRGVERDSALSAEGPHASQPSSPAVPSASKSVGSPVSPPAAVVVIGRSVSRRSAPATGRDHAHEPASGSEDEGYTSSRSRGRPPAVTADAGSADEAMPSVSRTRRRTMRASAVMDVSMAPNLMVVGAGLEGIAAVTGAALKRLFVPPAQAATGAEETSVTAAVPAPQPSSTRRRGASFSFVGGSTPSASAASTGPAAVAAPAAAAEGNTASSPATPASLTASQVGGTPTASGEGAASLTPVSA